LPSQLFFTLTAACFASFLYFQNKVDNHHNEIGDRSETLRNWRWSNVSEQLGHYVSQTINDWGDKITNEIEDGADLEDAGQEEMIVNLIEIDHEPQRLGDFVEEFQAREEITSLEETIREKNVSLRRWMLGLGILSFALGILFSQVAIPENAVVLSAALVGAAVTKPVGDVQQLRKAKAEFEEHWEEYRPT
jgi:hypothetical protein